MSPIKPHQNHSVLYVWATPGAAKDRLGEIVLDADQHPNLKVYVTAIAEKGLANKAIIALLSKKLGIAKSLFEIIVGEKDRHKRILIQVPVDELERSLKAATGSLF
ncbi:DUF167 domain-containing protein [Candidatus Bodocaedibacter vickermanii]|uniref:UPF0235 protein CPBP_00973 n=1 Tax=Candidatus Bodocaedibacter vickermanii TaxID=2741701 RepID=A0A7L9RUF7_9PROT|nr:DUF167 domain-containing protein [Candidatus Paracaedibacteraceae bacterium 'Lake Konstanz']